MRSVPALAVLLCAALGAGTGGGGVAARFLRSGPGAAARPARFPTSGPSGTGGNLTRADGNVAVDEHKIRAYLADAYETAATSQCNAVNMAEWAFNTNLNPQTSAELDNAHKKMAAFEKNEWQKHFQGWDESAVQDAGLRRQVHFVKMLGTAALPDGDFGTLSEALLAMQNAYSTYKVCPYENKDCDKKSEGLNLDPGIEEVITTSREYDKLMYYWAQWHDVGKLMKSNYESYVTLSNAAAKANGFGNMGEMWRDAFEAEDLEAVADALWAEVRPLYEELHTYALARLRAAYPHHIADNDTLIPGHVLGNMWGQTWINLYDILVPYPNASSYDITSALKEQNFDAKKMFEKADAFYQSLGLLPNAMCYGDKAMIVKPEGDVDVTCHASAWDFCDGKDFRIKMCTKVNQDDFRTIHHEMGHIQYYQQYAHQPYVLRAGANPGFHEAIGDTIALSVDTPKHLKAIDLLKDADYDDSRESRVNALMKMALEKVAFLPFGLLVDKWRWDVFAGNVKPEAWNEHWWQLKRQYQMISAPAPRNESYFDPGAKYHVPADSQYISYFVAHILQFQFYRALCIEAGQYDPDDPKGDPLHTCDFYNSKEAGTKLASGLRLGSSVHWAETLEIMTGSREMSGKALLEYFQPLYDFLREANGSAKPGGMHGLSVLMALMAPVVQLQLAR